MGSIVAAGDWFREARFGLFIHWGIYSLLGRGEQVLFREHLDQSEYRRLAHRFNPRKFDPGEWAAIAKDAGMRYAVLTTKHHDGFCLFNTTTTGYSSVRTATGRDLVADYVNAFRKAGLRVGLYFSLADWGYPAYFKGPGRDRSGFGNFLKMTHEQVCELCTNYGNIDLLWFDGAWPHSPAVWQARRLEKMIRTLQPGIVMNNRLDVKQGSRFGDYDTPEQYIKASNRPWEACLTSTYRWWGWHSGDRLWKSSAEIVADICKVADGGGNLLLNVGPKPNGTFPAPFVRRMREVGRWLKVNGEAVYGTGPAVHETVSIGFMTTGRNAVYLLVAFWPGEELHICGLKNRVRSARILGHSRKLNVTRDGEHIYVRGLPRKALDPYCTVIKLAVDGKPRAYPWAVDRLWQGDAARMAAWAERQGT